jgi:hypothetical protein
MNSFVPRLDVLPPSQAALWPKLGSVRERFVLYGGTALAFRLGHRASVDFEFFSFEPFEVEALRRSAPWIQEAECLQAEQNTLTVLHRSEHGRVNTLLPLQALCYFQEPSLGDLPEPIKSSLLKAVQAVR